MSNEFDENSADWFDPIFFDPLLDEPRPMLPCIIAPLTGPMRDEELMAAIAADYGLELAEGEAIIATAVEATAVEWGGLMLAMFGAPALGDGPPWTHTFTPDWRAAERAERRQRRMRGYKPARRPVPFKANNRRYGR